MRGRFYQFGFNSVSIAAVQDLLSVFFTGQEQVILRLHRFWLMNVVVSATLPAQQQLQLGVKRAQLGTIGSGGTVVTPTPMLIGDGAAVAVCHANDTTKATGFGAVADIWRGGCNIFQGLDVVLVEPTVGQSNSWGFVFEITTAPLAAALFSGGMTFEEMG